MIKGNFLSVVIVQMLFLPWFAHAYSTNDYNPDYVPYNFDAAVERKLCQDEMANFDADNNAIAKGYNDSLVDVILFSGIAWGLENANNLFEMTELYYSTEFKECIKADDERIEEEKQQATFQKALDECDLDFFENEMTDKERMDTYNERMACKETLVRESEESEVDPVPVYTPPVSVPVIFEEPVVYRAPVEQPLVTPAEHIQDKDTDDGTSEETEAEQITTAGATSTQSEVFEMTQEEIDALVAERVAKESFSEELAVETEETIPEESPGFFKQVWNFLFGWF
jgi:hypothetical protein